MAMMPSLCVMPLSLVVWWPCATGMHDSRSTSFSMGRLRSLDWPPIKVRYSELAQQHTNLAYEASTWLGSFCRLVRCYVTEAPRQQIALHGQTDKQTSPLNDYIAEITLPSTPHSFGLLFIPFHQAACSFERDFVSPSLFYLI